MRLVFMLCAYPIGYTTLYASGIGYRCAGLWKQKVKMMHSMFKQR